MLKKSKQKEVSWATNTYMITETWKWMNAQIKSAQTAHKRANHRTLDHSNICKWGSEQEEWKRKMGNKVRLPPQKPQGETFAKKKKGSSKEQSYKSYSTYENFHNCCEIYGAKYVNTTHWLAILSSQNPLCLVSITFYLAKTPFFPYCPKDCYKTYPTS